jgi:tetratricopeptide (TPR) repeat protein
LTLCYNSGVGLLSILHETPTVTLGNAFYNLAGAGYHAISAKDGLKRFLEGSIPPPDRNLTTRIAAWFLYRKYSTFIATDDVRESSTRKSHGYRDIQVTHFRWKQHDIKLTRARQIAPFSWNSYAASRMSATAGSIRETAPSSKLRAWGCKDFWLGNYIKAASLFERAYDSDHSHPNYLRYAAEAYYRAGKRKEALAALARAAVALPKNKRVRARQAVMRFLPPGIFAGAMEMTVPRQ